jgi:hypothetical protein
MITQPQDCNLKNHHENIYLHCMILRFSQQCYSIFWNTMLFILLKINWCFRETPLPTTFLLGLLFNPEDGGDKFLWNISWLSRDYMALHSSRKKFLHLHCLSTYKKTHSINHANLPAWQPTIVTISPPPPQHAVAFILTSWVSAI